MSSKKNIAIIDYRMGNLFSIKHACEHVGLNPIITSDPEIILSSDAAILPGVGAFGKAMENLEKLGLVDCIHLAVKEGKPLMGICLGFQLLMSGSEEFGKSAGLGVISGQVKRFPKEVDGKKIKIPQIGWNTLSFNSIVKNSHDKSPLFGIENNDFMYFVHSYYVKTVNNDVVLTHTTYEGVTYCSSILSKNVFATQFHPEKSGKKGLKIYSNWSKLI